MDDKPDFDISVVLQELEAVRESGVTNMLNRREVLQEAVWSDYDDLRAWLTEHPDLNDYTELLMRLGESR